MDMHRVDERVVLGDTEIWELTNEGDRAHPFHIHLIQFQVLDINGKPPKGVDRGWKDTISVHPGDKVRIIMKFENYSDPQTPYMYHCHILEHEDDGMMGQFLVLKRPKELSLFKDKPTVVVFIAGFCCAHCVDQIKLFDKVLGKRKINFVVVNPKEKYDPRLRPPLRSEVVTDPEKNLAGWFGLLHKGPAHGTIIVDSDGDVVWSDTKDEPYMDVESIVKFVSKLPKKEKAMKVDKSLTRSRSAKD